MNVSFKSAVAALTLAASAALPLSAQAGGSGSGDLEFVANLLGSSEVPAVASTGLGDVLVRIDLEDLEMRVKVTFSQLVGNVSAAHIHCCTAPGSNVSAATQTPSFIGFPTGVKAGSYDRTFDMSAAGSYSAGFLTANGNDPEDAFAALVAGLNAGQAYFNIHTSAFPGGEIRGQLHAVPEPQALAMMLAGLAGLGVVARRRRKA